MSDRKDNASIDRRSLLAASIASVAVSAVSGATPAAARADDRDTEPTPSSVGVTTPPEAIVDTDKGRVRGFARSAIYTFRHIPYGASVSGDRRFLPARPAEPWSGIRSCLSYGPVCPQPARDWSNDEFAFIADWDDGYQGEDCLNLNIWSPTLQPDARLPVIVWLHGGGFESGSSHDLPGYDGTRLAKLGVVVVSVNHRLGPFGFLDVSGVGGGEYAGSGNAGMTDLVLALKWVRTNIARFGGDPGSVTISGQSGGGGKVSTLMAMPSAEGLFHRAIVMSGSFSAAQRQESARAVTAALMRILAVSDLSALGAVPAERLVAAGRDAMREAGGTRRMPGTTRGPVRMSGAWSPVVDGIILPDEPWDQSAPAVSRNVPMMIGTVRDEFRLPNFVSDQAALEARVLQIYGPKDGPAMLAALQADFPDLNANDRNGVISGISWRQAALRQLELKTRQHGAPAYGYWFTYSPTLLDGRIGAPHCADIPFFFDNTERCDQQTGNSPEAQQLAATMAQAMVRFAATGDPGGSGLTWPPHGPTIPTMIFDRKCGVAAYPARRVFEVAGRQ